MAPSGPAAAEPPKGPPCLPAVLLHELEDVVDLGHDLGWIDLERELCVRVFAVEHAGVAQAAARQLDQPATRWAWAAS